MPATSEQGRFALDATRLAPYLADVLGTPLPVAEISTELVAGGHSNLTYLVRAGERTMMLRRGPVGASAGGHDMGREHRILVGLARSSVPAPQPMAFCSDPDVLGAPFLLMERVVGPIVRTQADAVALGAEGARRASLALVSTLAAIHDVDLTATGLDGLGRGTGYLERQAVRWVAASAAMPDAPSAVRALADLVAAEPVPATSQLALVHGDFRLDNVVLGPDDQVRAVLDWEMATVGDPLSDLGLLLVYWGEPGDLPVSPEYEVTHAAGFLSRRELVEAYAVASSRDVAGLDFRVLLAHLKMAVIVEEIVERTRRGLTPVERFSHLDRIPGALAERALALHHGST